MNPVLIAVIVVAVVLVITLIRSVRIVPQARAGVVERLGRYTRTQGAGVAVLLPFIDRLRPLIDLREQVVSFPPQPVITSDNLTVGIDSVIYFRSPIPGRQRMKSRTTSRPSSNSPSPPCATLSVP